MNRQSKAKDLKISIEQKAKQLDKLSLHVDKSSVCSDLYNRVVLEKAILNKELKDLENDSFISRVRQLMPRKKTLICDYFRK